MNHQTPQTARGDMCTAQSPPGPAGARPRTALPGFPQFPAEAQGSPGRRIRGPHGLITRPLGPVQNTLVVEGLCPPDGGVRLVNASTGGRVRRARESRGRVRQSVSGAGRGRSGTWPASLRAQRRAGLRLLRPRGVCFVRHGTGCASSPRGVTRGKRGRT